MAKFAYGLLFIGIMLPLLPLLPSVHAASAYQMPTLNGRWTGSTIGVKLPKDPTWANKEVLDALTVWNHAQIWFQANFAPNGKLYTFVATQDSTAKVVVVYHNLSRSAEYFTVGEASTKVDSRTICGAIMELTLYQGTKQISSYMLYMVAIHELGHVLGLGHTETKTDIMYDTLSNVSANLPSTLDLYAVSQLAGGSVPEFVTLPSTIGYRFVPETAVPEFPAMPLLIIFLFGGLAIITDRRKKSAHQ